MASLLITLSQIESLKPGNRGKSYVPSSFQDATCNVAAESDMAQPDSHPQPLTNLAMMSQSPGDKESGYWGWGSLKAIEAEYNFIYLHNIY